MKKLIWMLAAAWVALGGYPAGAAPVAIYGSGASANRIDMVILGDGYTAAQMPKFRTDAQKFVDAFFAFSPFAEYKKYFRVWRVEKPSPNGSKVSHSTNGTPGNTAFGAYYYCFRIDRLLCVVQSKVDAALTANGMTTAKSNRDIVIVIVNDNTYGGSGGPIAVTSTADGSDEIAIHELGHSFGHLDDEYVDMASCGRYTNPWGFNVTKQTARASLPWAKWIDAATPVPTPNPPTPATEGKPGRFTGAYYCATGWYRPTYNSMMNGYGPFYAINSEQLVRRMYEFVNPLNSVTPSATTVTIPKAGTTAFIANPIDPALPNLKYTWRINGVVKSGAKRFDVLGNSFGAQATLQLTVRDATPLVRTDPKAVMVETRSWTIKRGP